MHDAPIGPSKPRFDDKAKAVMKAIAALHQRFAGDSDKDLRSRFEKGDIELSDIRALRARAEATVHAVQHTRRSDPHAEEQFVTASSALNRLRGLEKLLFGPGHKGEKKVAYGSEEWQRRQQTITKNMFDPTGMNSYVLGEHAVEEGLLGRFTERLHPRDRQGQWEGKPGERRLKKRSPASMADHERRTDEHLKAIKGRRTLADDGLPVAVHAGPRGARTKAEQEHADSIDAKVKADREREKAEDEAYRAGVKKAESDYREALGPEGRKLHDEFDAAHKAWAAEGFEGPHDPKKRQRMEDARKALHAYRAKHKIERAKHPRKPYRHVSEP